MIEVVLYTPKTNRYDRRDCFCIPLDNFNDGSKFRSILFIIRGVVKNKIKEFE